MFKRLNSTRSIAAPPSRAKFNLISTVEWGCAQVSTGIVRMDRSVTGLAGSEGSRSSIVYCSSEASSRSASSSAISPISRTSRTKSASSSVVRQSNSAIKAVLALLTRNPFRIRETMRVPSSECPLMRKSCRPRPADPGQALQPNRRHLLFIILIAPRPESLARTLTTTSD